MESLKSRLFCNVRGLPSNFDISKVTSIEWGMFEECYGEKLAEKLGACRWTPSKRPQSLIFPASKNLQSHSIGLQAHIISPQTPCQNIYRDDI